MSRKDDRKKDSDPGLGTAVAAGAGLLLGAAALYGAKKLFDFINGPSEQPSSSSGAEARSAPPAGKCFSDSDSDDDRNYVRVSASSNRSTADDSRGMGDRGSNGGAFNRFGTSGASNATGLGARPKTGPGMTPSAPPVSSLAEELLSYSNDYLVIDKFDKVKATAIVKQIKEILTNQMKIYCDNSIMIREDDEIIVEFGSSAEGCQIYSADKFDIMVKFLLSTEGCAVFREEAPSKCTLKYLDGREAFCDDDGNIDMTSLLGYLEGNVKAVLKNMDQMRYCCEVSSNVNRIILNVTYLNDSQTKENQLMIYLYPVMSVDDKLYVHNSSFNDPNVRTNSSRWKRLNADKEIDKLKSFEQHTHLELLKIFKGIRRNIPEQFGKLSSYHYKTVLFRVMDDQPDKSEWSSSKLAERFIDMLLELGSCCKEKVLEDYFDSKVNLFEDIEDEILSNISVQINKIVGQSDFESLLERRAF